MQGYSDLLSQTDLTEEGRLLLYAIQRATKTLSLSALIDSPCCWLDVDIFAVTNNVLDWSKLERDTEAVCHSVALDMRTVCESILVLLPNKDDEAEVDLFVVVAPDVPSSLFLDETYIHRILMNLLSNAIKFTRSGYILLLVEMNNGRLTATVRDTGSGIPPSFLPQLFEPFKQAQTRGSQRGTGLGMSIVKQLLHKMQGTIDVESLHTEAGDIGLEQSGSVFTITIPVSQSSTPQPETLSITVLPSIAIFRGNNARSLDGLRIAWAKFGFDVVIVNDFCDLSDLEWRYVWADATFLNQNPSHLKCLLEQDQWLVLVPYDTQNSLEQLPGLLSAPHFIPLQKPLIWHSFQQRIAAASEPSNRSDLARTVRFAPKVDVLECNGHKEQLHEDSRVKNLVILLVEDNPVSFS